MFTSRLYPLPLRPIPHSFTRLPAFLFYWGGGLTDFPPLSLSLSFSLFFYLSLGLSLSCPFLLLSLSEKCVRPRSRWGGDKQLVRQQWSGSSSRVVWFSLNVCKKDGCNNCKQENTYTAPLPKPSKPTPCFWPFWNTLHGQQLHMPLHTGDSTNYWFQQSLMLGCMLLS